MTTGKRSRGGSTVVVALWPFVIFHMACVMSVAITFLCSGGRPSRGGGSDGPDDSGDAGACAVFLEVPARDVQRLVDDCIESG